MNHAGKGEEKDQFEVKDQKQDSHKLVDDIEFETGVLIGIETTFVLRQFFKGTRTHTEVETSDE